MNAPRNDLVTRGARGRFGMHPFCAGFFLREKLLEGNIAAPERYFRPGYIFGGVQAGCNAFIASTVMAVDGLPTEKNVYLARFEYVDDRQQAADLDICTGFLKRFSGGTLFERFPQFHEAGWHGPVAEPRLYGTLAKQYSIAEFSDAANDHFWVLIADRIAAAADITKAIVACGYCGV
jgi:hypothetical protein